ncbi:MAG: PEP-CTERM sorting domain-containing protein, partial [Trichodesmium sp.]
NDGFSLLSGAELEEIKALDFGTNDPAIYSKAKTFGFKFDASKLPTGDALITLLHECINDGMAMAVTFPADVVGGGGIPGDGSDESRRVPEPGSIVSLSLIGVALAGIRKKSEQ